MEPIQGEAGSSAERRLSENLLRSMQGSSGYSWPMRFRPVSGGPDDCLLVITRTYIRILILGKSPGGCIRLSAVLANDDIIYHSSETWLYHGGVPWLQVWYRILIGCTRRTVNTKRFFEMGELFRNEIAKLIIPCCLKSAVKGCSLLW